MPQYQIAALYKFVALPDFRALRAAQETAARGLGLTGTLLFAEEGVNGTLAGRPAEMARFLEGLRADPRLAELEIKFAEVSERPFRKLKMRLKREIVSMGAPGGVSEATTGARVAAEAWDALISAPDVVVIDVRNDYEVALGSFAGALDPGTSRFRDFPAWAAREAERLAVARTVATFCTGGVRCEKATAHLRGMGLRDVRQLSGGILRYLEHAPADGGLWRGRCFVFDGRVSVGPRLALGDDVVCFGCRRPVTAAARAHPAYEPGVACPACVDETTPERRERLRERERQMRLADARGVAHLAED